MNKVIITFLLLFLGIIFNYSSVSAQNADSCNNRYLTLVNPVRGRDLWFDKSLNPILDQYRLINSYGFSATWLLQYDAIEDSELTREVRNFDNKQERGVFLEVSPMLAKDSRVIYPHEVAWDDPNAVFLSGYSQSERKRIINRLFKEFKKVFGYYPKSVGAWWIDSYSLNYLKQKYDISSALIVADQRSTDDYGVWGQWWGIPYYPTKANILTPASNQENKQDVVIIQWAQRDLTKADGDGPAYSNYSLQANDYTNKSLTTDYFHNLVNKYLDCSLPIGQITVGLETGIESVKSFPEYKNQLLALSKIRNLESVTISEFADKYKAVYPNNPPEIKLTDGASTWVMTPQGRENDYLGDKIKYQADISFADYFVADNNKFLDRRLPLSASQNPESSFPWYILVFLIGAMVFWKKGILKYFVPSSLFIFSSFALVLRSFQKYGWNVYYGPYFKNIELTKVILAFLSLAVIFILLLSFQKKRFKNWNLFVWLLPLSFSFDTIFNHARYTFMEGKYYFGFMLDALRFVGINSGAVLVNKDLVAVQAASLLRFPFEEIWNSQILSFVIYPFVHIVLATVTWLIFRKLPKRFSKVIITLTLILYIIYLVYVLKIDPRVVTPL